MTKNKKEEGARRRNKSRQKMKKKGNLRLVKSRQEQRTEVIYRPGLPYMGASKGFRTISMAQAMMEYAKPLMKFVEDDETCFNAALKISMMLWNYSLSVEKGNEDKKIEQDILKAVKGAFGLDKNEAKSLLTKMVERRAYLFPSDFFMRKGISTTMRRS